MVILNKSIFKRIQLYNYSLHKNTKYLDTHYKNSKLFKEFKSVMSNNKYISYNKYKCNNTIKTTLIDNNNGSLYYEEKIPISHNCGSLIISNYNIPSKIIEKITWDIDDLYVDRVIFYINDNDCFSCNQPYFKNIRKLNNMDNNEIPLSVINGLIPTHMSSQKISILIKQQYYLPKYFTVKIYCKNNNNIPNIQNEISVIPMYQTFMCNTRNKTNFILDKILIPLDIENIIINIDSANIQLKLKRIDYYNNNSVFSLSSYYGSNDILTYGLGLSRIEHYNIIDINNNILTIDICYIVINLLCNREFKFLCTKYS
jgi:hypothetical protein